MTAYADFLAGKALMVSDAGPVVMAGDLHPMLHPWQAEIVSWAARVGRAAIWADTGLGKSIMQVEWLRVCKGDGSGLIVAPLVVCQQTVREAAKVGVAATYVRDPADIEPGGIYVTNYEMVEHFPAALFGAVVLDEASILKQSDGKTRTRLIKHFASVPFRLACTATPAPNDPEELTNQAEFLGQMSRVNMLAAYFVHDNDGWRTKGHALTPMYRWMSTWAVALRRPSDMGYPDDDYILPGLRVIPHFVDLPHDVEGELFAVGLGGVSERAQVRRDSLSARCELARDIVAADPNEPWLLWCGLNQEGEMLADLIPKAVNVEGSWSPDDKSAALLNFADGSLTRLITKPKIAGFGMNWQHCARMVFVGLSDSYEAYYQAIRRCYRYGQGRVVEAHVVLSDRERDIAVNVARKEREAASITARLVEQMQRARKETP